MLRRIQDFFGITRAESRGAVVLMVLSLVLVAAPSVLKWKVLPLFKDDELPFTIEYLDSTAALIPDQPGNRYDRAEYAQREAGGTRAARLVPFDPNTASTDELQALGVPRFLALRIEKYRQKGGRFRKKEDLKKIYDFPPALYASLEEYILLPGDALSANPAEKYPDGGPTGGTSGGERTPPLAEVPLGRAGRPALTVFDINTADTVQLAALRGIGSKLSARIVKFREALGGFHSTDQYAEIYGLDSLALSELRRYGRPLSPPRKIPINTVSAEEMAAHPYFRNRKLNQVIVRYREQHGPYASAEALRAVRILDEATLRKIEPYLAF